MNGVILAGGKGSRMHPFTEFNPKALMPIHGTPILIRQIRQLIDLNCSTIIILLGHDGETIRSYLESFSFPNIYLIQTPEDFAPEERLLNGRELIGDDFILLYCDNFLDDNRQLNKHISANSPIRVLLEKRHKGNFATFADDRVEYSHEIRSETFPFVEMGYIRIKTRDFWSILESTKSLHSTFKHFSINSSLYGTISEQTLISVSDSKRYVSQRLYGKIAILDRDGVLNQRAAPREYIQDLSGFVLQEHVLLRLQLMAQEGFTFCVATNQPGISLGSVSEINLNLIHKSMVDRCRKLGIFILCVQICPHNWNQKCSCRKPEPGMLINLITLLQLAPEELLFIGDEEKDKLAALGAKVKYIDVNDESFLADPVLYLENNN